MTAVTLAELQRRIEDGSVKTVVCGLADLWGRIVGKRVTAKSFMQCLSGAEGLHASVYLFCTDMDMDPRPGYALTGWDKGFQDFVMKPDLSTIRLLPWTPGTAFVLCDAIDETTGELVPVAPRSILKRQIARAETRGITFKCATELEFFMFRDTYDAAWHKRYRDLVPTSRYRADYHILQSTRDEEIIGEIRDAMNAAGIEVENAKTEWGLGQQEIALRYTDALEMADRHVLYKCWVKELLSLRGLSATFMAKPFIDEIGSSCHVHISLWDKATGQPTSYDGGSATHMSRQFGSFIAGMIDHGREYAYLAAPTINSYKRFRKTSFAPVQLCVGNDNRTCGFRLVGHDKSFRVESRIPGADANPYLALAGLIASGLSGIERARPTPDLYADNAYEDPTLPRVPATMREAVSLFAASDLVRSDLGSDVHDHLKNFAENELDAFEQETVTDWELIRYFERI
ncbi:glutamine synthetase family protein [Hyphomicrobium sp.]|uniref:glutamine synthetase family protein n=1 Tax=Hyphomicrobium sp. TaxID=82 RepID=UPI001D2F7154|nr:glutamine synthetase family protein [Hyphomicrobium sp.]MBY0559789.1 glutamine synthetase family protein [Hyphomicrobium sp.]